MLHEIWSDRPSFKRLKFRPGLNIVLANRAETATSTDKRNAVGKSSLLEIFHFMLGGRIAIGSPLSAPELQEDVYRLTLDVGPTQTTVARASNDRDRLFIEGGIEGWPIRPDIDMKTGEVTIRVDVWCDLLGQVFLGLPPSSQIETGSYLSFRSCISYFIRRQRGDGYADWRRHVGTQKAVDVQVNLAFLLGLDYRLPLELQRVREKELAKRELGKALKQGLVSRAIGSLGKLRTQHRKISNNVDRLQKELNGFEIVDAYEQLERQANDLQREIDSLSNENLLDRELIADIDEALHEEAPPEVPEIERLYREAGVVLPGVSLARYDDVRRFHETIISNRKTHLSAEREDAARRLEKRDSRRRTLSEERNRILSTLNAGGALSQYRRLDNELSVKRSEYEALTAQLDMAERFEALKADLRVERASVERSIANDIRERREIIVSAMEDFETISAQIYKEPAIFEILAGDRGLDFVINAADIASEGVSKMQIFSFDLMLATICAKRGHWPGFLIHDSHIFDGVDGRQIASALSLGHQRSLDLKGQYIVTMNSDDLEKAEREAGVSFKQHIVKPVLDDTETGGLFGFRFRTPIKDADADQETA